MEPPHVGCYRYEIGSGLIPFTSGLTCPENAELQVARKIFIMVA
jgi:hypothetical protein